MYQNYIKRILDLVLSILTLLVFSWLFIIIMLLIKLTSRGPLFFRQERIGIHKSRFFILKFRTMKSDTPKDVPTHLLSNPEQYITQIGKFLRKTSLDELPQLFNIIKGDMSIVGPRPALWNQFDLIEERDQYGVNDIKPGLTGWAQVNGRDELPIPDKAKLDGVYRKNMGFLFDLRCILKTISCIALHTGVREGAPEVKG